MARRATLYARSASCGRRAEKRYVAKVCMGTLSLWITSPRPLNGPAGPAEKAKRKYMLIFFFTRVSKPEKILNYVARWCSHSFTSWKKCLLDALTEANVTVVVPSSSCMACFRRVWTRRSSSSNSWSFATICSSLRHTWNTTHTFYSYSVCSHCCLKLRVPVYCISGANESLWEFIQEDKSSKLWIRENTLYLKFLFKGKLSLRYQRTSRVL